ncbi:4-hydroxythreonine-4-phosphate dehydrogenase PdxA [Maricaulis sp.]|uniref:4-hydroxythreonine-4-phosphate dehydrogenase PdxA n=1 Tax=Maricaulis sp. TaxID=1486257 RepID=UPI001B0E1053|nr:4-hydroxythreonine-4-phosphate dehydrogenase PdxA [Maricaulis sp.]
MPLPSPIGVTMGDPAGIGPEIISKAWHELRERSDIPFVVIGDPSCFSQAVPIESAADAAQHFQTELPVFTQSCPLSRPVRLGVPCSENAAAVRSAIEDAVSLARTGEINAVVTAPIAKSVMYQAGFDFPGHTEFLADLTKDAPLDGPRGPLMMLSGGGLRVVLTTIHIALEDAVRAVNPERIKHVARLAYAALRRDFGIARPRLALAGLNPHAGEDGALGREEIEIINPAAAELRDEGINITDAMAPDTMFHAEARAQYDAAICHYHDQGLIPVKTLDFHGGVNTTLGLPIVRTSPDHGTAFGIAGKGQARADSLIAALKLAASIAENRTR